jgi:ABC-type multidrug transport system ATPase subunit
MPPIALTIDSIVLSFQERAVLHGVYMKLEARKIYALHGLNGAGKSVLFKIIMGLLSPDSGTVFIGGIPYEQAKPKVRFSKIAYLPQDPFIPPDLRVSHLCRMVSGLAGVLQEAGLLADHGGKRVSELSYGWRRYLEIAFILALDRPIHILDEPFTGLEPLLIERVVRDLRRVRDVGKTILLTDHYHQYVADVADVRMLLSGGRCCPFPPSDSASPGRHE